MELDYIKGRPRTNLLGVLLLVLGLATAGISVFGYMNLHKQIAASEGDSDKLRRLAVRNSERSRQTPEMTLQRQKDIQQARLISRQLTLPWDQLFAALETTKGKHIALLSLQPDPGKQILRITGEAKNFNELLAFVARLEHSPVFADTVLSSHEIREQDPDKPIRFGLAATWKIGHDETGKP